MRLFAFAAIMVMIGCFGCSDQSDQSQANLAKWKAKGLIDDFSQGGFCEVEAIQWPKHGESLCHCVLVGKDGLGKRRFWAIYLGLGDEYPACHCYYRVAVHHLTNEKSTLFRLEFLDDYQVKQMNMLRDRNKK